MSPLAAVHALSALAQESRLGIYRLLVQAGPAGLVVGRIAEIMNIPATTLSFHLKSLSHGGLVHHRQEGRFVRYIADFETMHGLIDYLTENCCGSNASTCTPVSTYVRKKRS